MDKCSYDLTCITANHCLSCRYVLINTCTWKILRHCLPLLAPTSTRSVQSVHELEAKYSSVPPRSLMTFKIEVQWWLRDGDYKLSAYHTISIAYRMAISWTRSRTIYGFSFIWFLVLFQLRVQWSTTKAGKLQHQSLYQGEIRIHYKFVQFMVLIKRSLALNHNETLSRVD